MTEPFDTTTIPASEGGQTPRDRAPRPLWRRHSRLTLAIVIKLGVVAVLLAMPVGLAVAAGTVHIAIVLLVIGVAAAMVMVKARRGKRQ
jgi:putative Mn2+ efflux pump MntP